jgi:outer membrane protein assembly factor BamD
VQEMLAEGQYRVAYFYYVKGDRRAAAGRLIPLVRRYPLYSKSDSALWMLGDIFEKSERKDVAGSYYAQIVKNYPLSSRAADAKGKLKAFGMPIPQADPKAVAWMRAEQNAPRPHKSLVRNPIAMLHSPPDVHTAARNGSPVLGPESDEPGGDILSGVSRPAMGTGGGTTGIVATVKPGEPAPPGTTTSSTTTEDVNSNAGSGSDAATGTAGASGTDPQAGTTGTAAGDGTAASNAPQDGSASTDNSKTDNTQAASANSDQSQDQKESSSKKKGLRRLLPW